MREVLGRCLRMDPAALRFTTSARGKPRLAGAAPDVHFDRGELGIDVEQHRPLAALPADERLAAFYRDWTRKESLIKAVGEGLFLRLDTFDVSLAVDTGQALLALRDPPAGREEWAIVPLAVDGPCSAALTVEGGRSPRLLRWSGRPP